MAASQSANPVYHDPAPCHSRDRRSSSRRSFASPLSRSNSNLDSPRPTCPKDGDAFSYDPTHLETWYLPQELWARLPAQLRSRIAAVQHAGAAVLTGFERFDDFDSKQSDRNVPDAVLPVQFDDLPPPKFRTISNASSVFLSDYSSPVTVGSPASHSEWPSPSASYASLPQSFSPYSSISLGTPAQDPMDKRSRSREHSFSTPLEPHDAYSLTELSHLRTESLPRLRHCGHKVDTEWYEAKRSGSVSADDVKAFENWWAEKKCHILGLNERGKGLASARGLASTGMGWSAP